jgi:hypothetical protein
VKILKKIIVVFFILALFSLTSVYADENINSCEDVSNPYIADSTEGVGLSYDDASIMAEDSNEEIEDEDKYFELSRTSYPGWHWEVNPESYGVELVSRYDVVNAPPHAWVGAPATTYFKFHIISDDYFVDLQLINPWGDIEPPILNPKSLTLPREILIHINNETPIDIPSVENNAENNTLEENTTKHIQIQRTIEPNHVYDVLVYDTPTDSDNNTLVEQNSTQNNILQENTTTQNNSSVMVNNTQSTNNTQVLSNNTQATNNNTSNNSSVMENTANPLIALLLSCILIPMGIYRKRK